MAATVEIIWDQYDKLIIRDVHEKWHDRIRNFMFENYFKQNRLFKQLEYFDDPLVEREYLKYVDHILYDECSIVAIHEHTDEIFAVALVKCMTKEWRSWTALQINIDQCKFSDYIELLYRMVNQYANDCPDEPVDSLHLFEYYIHDGLRSNSEFMRKFFNSISETGRHMKMPKITFLALSALEQEECYDQGFESVNYSIYSVFKVRNQRPFAKLRDIEEMEAVLYQMDVDPLIPYYDMIVRGIDDVVVQHQGEKRQSVAVVKRERSVHSADD